MFIMTNVGAKISELRKAKNMTQMELADKLGISFQAVSNWERGNSMPDISKLPELAQLFDTTVDEILGERSELVDSVVDGKIDEYLETNPVTPGQIGDIAPILKPDQIDKIVRKTPLNEIDDIAGLLPFISSSVIDDIARKMVEEEKSIAGIAPFVSQEVIAELAAVNYKRRGMSALYDIAAFIPQNQLQKIAEEEYAVRGLGNIAGIAPFLDRGFLGGLARDTMQKDGINAIGAIIPFLDRDMLSEYVRNMYL